MKIWTVTPNDDSGQPLPGICMTEDEADEAAHEWAAGYWDAWMGEDTPMPLYWKDALSDLQSKAGFMDSISVECHDISHHPVILQFANLLDRDDIHVTSDVGEAIQEIIDGNSAIVETESDEVEEPEFTHRSSADWALERDDEQEPDFDKMLGQLSGFLSGFTYTAHGDEGAWYPARVDLATGDTVQFQFPFAERDDAIRYAIDNFGKFVDEQEPIDAAQQHQIEQDRITAEEDEARIEGEIPAADCMYLPMIDGRKMATILAALRFWQNDGTSDEDEIATDGGTIVPLTTAEIDDLCEELNQ